MQDRKEWLRKGTQALPAQEPWTIRDRGEDQQYPKGREMRSEGPTDQTGMKQAERDAIEQTRSCRKKPGAAADEPVPCEDRNDAGSYDRDQDHDGGQPQSPSQTRGNRFARYFQMHQKIGGSQYGDGNRHRKIAPVPAGDDLVCRRGREQQEKGRIDGDRKPERKPAGNENSEAPKNPYAGKSCEEPALYGSSTRPVRYRGQEKPGNCRGHEPKQHFMDVPAERIEPAG